MIIAFPISFQTILWPLQIVSDFISFLYPVFSYLKQQQPFRTLQNVSPAFRMSLFTEKYIFLLGFVLIHICFHPKKNKILKRWTKMPHFVAFQLFSNVKKKHFPLSFALKFVFLFRAMQESYLLCSTSSGIKNHFSCLNKCIFMLDRS